MKNFTTFIMVLLLSFSLAACGAPTQSGGETPQPAASEGTPTPYVDAYLSTDYTDFANLRNQLAFGTLKLEGSEQAVTPEQAKILVPLWQAIVALSGDETTAAEELTAVQNQVAEAMTPMQLEAIAAMQITNTDLNAFYAEHGVVFPTPAPGVTRVPGKNTGLSQADKEATKTAAQALGTPVGMGSGSGQVAKTLLFESTIEYLTAVAGF